MFHHQTHSLGRLRPRWFQLAGAIITLGIALAACGQDGTSGEPAASAPTATKDVFGASTGFKPTPAFERRRIPDKPGPRRVHIVVSLDAPPESSDLEGLAQDGLTLLEPLERKVWFASIASRDIKDVSSLDGVQQVGFIMPGTKLSQDLKDDPAPYPYQRRGEGRIAYSVLFHKDVTANDVQELASVLDIELEEFDPKVFGVVRGVTLNIRPDGLQSLTEADIVARVEPSPPPVLDFNRDTAQPLSNVDKVQSAPFNLDGSGIRVGVWESGGVVLSTHQELTPRVTVATGQSSTTTFHAAHVAGTIGSSGANSPAAEGMAPNVNITSWDANADTVEMANAANPTLTNTPIQISNHSYGSYVGWDGTDNVFTPELGIFYNNQNLFGSYEIISANLDNVVYQNGLIVVQAAGNERDDVPVAGVNGGPADCLQGGLGIQADCIGPRPGAKNIITVGAMRVWGVLLIAGFSSYGPTDDGRIKPDLMAHGFNMTSLSDTSNTAIGSMGGTSAAAPVVSGIAALVLQEANSANIAMSPAGMKALLIQTATDVQGKGQATAGPDYATGWGVVNAEAAVELLRKGGLIEGSLKTSRGAPWYSAANKMPTKDSVWSYKFNVTREKEVHVTLAWDDPPGVPGGLTLINDLDLRLTGPDGVTHTPWILGGAANPGQAAVRNGGNDSINNVEQVSVLSPMAGVWTVTVSAAAGNLPIGPQTFAVSGPRRIAR